MLKEKSDRTTWAIGGGVPIGLGVAFFLLPISALYFVGSFITSLGAGIIASSSYLDGIKKHNPALHRLYIHRNISVNHEKSF
jgi:hypothetical protein